MNLEIKATYSIVTEDGYSINPKVITILKQVEKTGSLNAAVIAIGMSYSYAWSLIHKTSCMLSVPIVISRKGGNGGGEAHLTEAGHKLLTYCNKLENDFEQMIGTHQIIL